MVERCVEVLLRKETLRADEPAQRTKNFVPAGVAPEGQALRGSAAPG